VRLLLAGVIALGAVLCIVSVLYLMGPKTKCAHDVPQRPGIGGGLLCHEHKRTDAWERISGAVKGD
jgi:hypothetical protein